MAQAKKKQSTKTAKKQTRSTKSGQCQTKAKQARRTSCSNNERNHIYIVTAMGMIAAILLCANVAMMMA